MRLSRAPGLSGIVLAQRAEARLDALRPVRTDRGVTVATPDGRVRVDLIEHLLAAVGGLGVAGELRIAVEGDEIPLLDGGALRFAEALRALESPPARARRAPAAGDARGRLRARAIGVPLRARAPAQPPRRGRLPAPVGAGSAAWGGDAAAFVAHVAPARTFGWAHEIEALRAAGRAAEVDLASVIVFDARGGVLPGCRPPGPDEPARHKLLDLIGDLALYGGPPRGEVHASAPGHGATHAVVARALAEGVLV